MSKIERLIRNYERFVSLPWERNLSCVQKVWFIVYDQMDERRLRVHLDEFSLVTKKAHHEWIPLNLTDSFASWMASQEYRDGYFQNPEHLEMALSDFRDTVATNLTEHLLSPSADENTVVAVLGIGSLFGFTRVSELVAEVERAIRGRLVVFFPGEHSENNYRLLDARDGWNYMAIPITAHEGDLR